MKNKFNRLTSKEWLPFQKSWFRYTGKRDLYRENIRFFCQAENNGSRIYYYGNDNDMFFHIAKENNETAISNSGMEKVPIQFAVFDLTDIINNLTTVENYRTVKDNVIRRVKSIYPLLTERRFIAVFIPNIEKNGLYYPYAWDLAKSIGRMMSLKDEKIGCDESGSTFYTLYFRKDENSVGLSVCDENMGFTFNNLTK